MNYDIAIISDERYNFNYSYCLNYNLNIYLFNKASIFLKEKNILHFNLIIIDIIMTEMTGIEFLKRILERNEIYKEIPILFFSKLAQDREVCKMLSNIIDSFPIGFLEKPIEDKIFLTTIIDIVKNKNISNYNKFKYKKFTLMEYNLNIKELKSGFK